MPMPTSRHRVRGEARRRATTPGEHEAIVGADVFDRVQALLRHHARTGGATVKNRHGALLRGLLRCAPCDAAMGHTYTVKGEKRYRYYTCHRAQKAGWSSCPTKAVPAGEIERFVVEQIEAIGADPALVAAPATAAEAERAKRLRRVRTEHAAAERAVAAARGRLAAAGSADAALCGADLERAEEGLRAAAERVRAAGHGAFDAADLTAALQSFGPVWTALYPKEQARVLRLLVEQVRYDGREGTLAVTFRPAGIQALPQETATAEAGR